MTQAIKRPGFQKGNKLGGRPKGSPNKQTTLLKDAILTAAEQSGDKEGMVGYLLWLSRENSSAFASLLGKVLPHTIEGSEDKPLRHLVGWLPTSE